MRQQQQKSTLGFGGFILALLVYLADALLSVVPRSGGSIDSTSLTFALKDAGYSGRAYPRTPVH